MSTRAVQDRFQCPRDFVKFSAIADDPSTEGFFQFGPGTVCYGRSSSGTSQSPAAGSLHDAWQDIVVMNGEVGLPFDPDEVIDNLRLEHYLQSPEIGYERALKKIYYWMRPLTNKFLRHEIQKFHARNWKKFSFPRWPVDTSVDNLCEDLMLLSMQAKGVQRVPFVWFWPNGSQSCMTMTHDVETEAGRDHCEELMDLDDAAGIKASFQLVPEKRYSVRSSLLDTIRSRGFELGVQDLNHDGRLFDSREEFIRRAQIINRYGREYGAMGFRSAVLYRKPEWFDALDFSFDMSMPNVAHLDPQRGGCCTVMPYYIGDLVELPVTTTQDYTLFHLLGQRSIDLWKMQTELILAKNGLLSFIVHPDYVIEPEFRALYSNLLEYLRCTRENKNVWMALPGEINRWWRERSEMWVVPEGKSFRIEGEGAERAALAFAMNVNGRLVYQCAKATGAS